jgi:hypothetical protein
MKISSCKTIYKLIILKDRKQSAKVHMNAMYGEYLYNICYYPISNTQESCLELFKLCIIMASANTINY